MVQTLKKPWGNSNYFFIRSIANPMTDWESLPWKRGYRRIWRDIFKAEKVIGYLVAKNILGFLCAHENNTFDKLFLPVLTTTFALLPRA